MSNPGPIPEPAEIRQSQPETRQSQPQRRTGRALDLEAPGADASLVAEMTAADVHPATARRLAASFPAECRRQLAWLPYRDAQDPGAFLAAAVRDKYGPPKKMPQKAAGGPNGGTQAPSVAHWYVGDGDRARARHLGHIPPEVWPVLEERAARHVREVMRLRCFSLDTVAAQMARIWRSEGQDGADAHPDSKPPSAGTVASERGISSAGRRDCPAVAAWRAKRGAENRGENVSACP